MAAFIHGMGLISSQGFGSEGSFLSQPKQYSGSRLAAVEPDYSEFIDPKAIRRMSRIIKMGIASAKMALQAANVSVPDAIITGTGYGCLEDTGVFLSKMIENKEQALNPTPFIQSTHNTIGSQVALLLQCHGYNQTYTQRAHSFEHALLDAVMQSNEHSGQILVGGIDEITDFSHEILSRFSLFKSCLNTLDLFNDGEGTVNGEGSSFFLLSSKESTSGVRIASVSTLFKPTMKGLTDAITNLVTEFGPIDFVLSGKSGDDRNDAVLDGLVTKMFAAERVGFFKHLCGEYPGSSGFATGLAAMILEARQIPAVVGSGDGAQIRNVLIFNQYLGRYFSLILLKR